ncbi:unannotated protein [freshwater metagenome]|uniref:Unannotated protein n=1 Tax=freshwater metagenome TaxID=449393 RepID=A0A6J6J2T1_9ZZZZ
MRRVPLALEGVALLDTEAVLFVHDDERKFIERNRVSEQRVSTNDKAGRAARNRELSPFFLHRRKTADEQGRIQPLGEGSESGDDRPRVLRCEDFRRSNQRGLPAILNCSEHRADGDERLPRTDLTLNETIHRSGARHVLVNLGSHR